MPARPAPGQPRDPEAQAGYVSDLHGVAVDCRDDVTGMRERKEAYRERYEAERAGPIGRFFRNLTD